MFVGLPHCFLFFVSQPIVHVQSRGVTDLATVITSIIDATRRTLPFTLHYVNVNQ